MKKLPVGFFENIPVWDKTKDKRRDEDDEIVPIEFSQEVLDGKKKVTVSLSDNFYISSKEIADSILPKKKRKALAKKYEKYIK